MDILSIIPARAGSKGLPRKNLKNFCGHPLLSWSIKQSLSSMQVTRTIVSTECEEIAEVARKYGAEVPFLRPESLALDETPTEPVLLHCIEELHTKENYKPELIILLQPTSPIRRVSSIDDAINQLKCENSDSLLSVTPTWHFFWKKKKRGVEADYDYLNRPRRQEIPSEEYKYKENGSIYITKNDILKKHKNRLGGKISLFVMTHEEEVEIDSSLDFKYAELTMKELISDY